MTISYFGFFISALAITIGVAAALAGPASGLCLVAFWAAHHYFVIWLYFEATAGEMTDRDLQDAINFFVKDNPDTHTYGAYELARINSRGDKLELKIALTRVVALYDEQIKRSTRDELDFKSEQAERKKCAEELAKLTR